MAMNLGDARLSHVNTSRPQLNRADSKQSIAASDDYYSVSENSSEDRETVIRYQTPPLRNESAQSGRRADPMPTHEEVIEPVTNPAIAQSQPQPQPQSLPQPAQRETRWHDAHVDASAPTPGVDDSPYIQFAIDQLTRDEEVAGRSRESKENQITRKAVPPAEMAPVREVSREPSAATIRPLPRETAVAPIVTEEMPRGSNVTPVVHNENTRRDRYSPVPVTPPPEALLKASTPSSSRVSRSTYSSIPKASSKRISSVAEDQEPLIEDPMLFSAQQEAQNPQSSQLFPPFELHPSFDLNDGRPRAVLMPVVPKHDFRYPPLRFVPAPLRLFPILGLIVLCLALIVLLLVSTVLSSKHYGLLGYDGVGTARYFVFEYLPQLLAAIVVIWLLVVQAAIQRILPFVLLARSNGYPDEDVFEKIPIYITNYVLPNRSLLRLNIALKFCAVAFWLALFTIPLASSLYQTRWDANVSNGSFLWATVQPVSIILIVIYFLLIIALFIVYLYFNRRTTGLKWDPVSLADIIALLRRTSNLTSARTSRTTRRSSPRPHSLGYWESTSHPGQIFHGIGAANEPPLASSEKDSLNEPESNAPLPQSTFESWHSHSWTRNRSQPVFLRESFLIIYSIIAIGLLTAFLVVTYLHSALKSGFIPLLPTATSATSSFTSFSASDFLYSFVPSLIGLLLPLCWAPIDTAFRYLQPWSTLTKQYPSSASQAFGHPASTTLLLSYPSQLPLFITVQALLQGHIRIAWFSLVGLISWAAPVVAGGIFTAQYISSASDPELNDQARGGSILMLPDIHALYVLSAVAGVYALSWLLTLPGARQRAITGADGKAVDVRYLAGIRSVVDKSVLREEIWKDPRTRRDLVSRLTLSEGAKERMSGRWAMPAGRIVRL